MSSVKESVSALLDDAPDVKTQLKRLEAERRACGKPPLEEGTDYTIQTVDGKEKLVLSDQIQEEIATDTAIGPSGKDTSLLRKQNSTLHKKKPKEGSSSAQQSAEVVYWQAAAKIEELKHIYKKPSSSDATWEKSEIISDINVDKPGESKGLSDKDQQALHEMWGKNELTPKNVVPWWRKLLAQFINFFSLLLEIGGLLCFIAYGVNTKSVENLYLGVVLWVVVTVTCIFSFMQERSADNLMQKFRELGGSKNVVRRDDGPGQNPREVEVMSTELVPGDVVVLRLGDKITADCRILQTYGEFKCEQSALTGEPDAILKTSEVDPCRELLEKEAGLEMDLSNIDARNAILDANRRYVEKRGKQGLNPALRCANIAMFGTAIKEGKAVALVAATGDFTVMGMLYEMTTEEGDKETPLAKEISRFVKIISAIAIVLGITFLIISFAMNLEWINVIVFTIGIIVANVPEGLLATVTVCLTLTAGRMKDVMVLVKKLDAVETLGSTSIICSDKTGTLTQNKMTVVFAWTAKYNPGLEKEQKGQYWNTAPQGFNVSNPFSVAGYELATMDTTEPSYIGNPVCRDLVQIGALCSSAKWDVKDKLDRRTGKVICKFADLPIQERTATGDASEQAILKFSEARLQGKEGGVEGMRARHPDIKGGVIPFDSKNKWMLTSCMMPNEEGELVNGRMFVKGGADRVWGFVDRVAADDGNKNTVLRPRAEYEDAFEEVLALMSGQGLRLFCFAYVDIPEDSMQDKDKLVNGDETQEGSFRHMLKLPPKTDNWENDIRQPNFTRLNGPYTKGDTSFEDGKSGRSNGLIFAGILALQDPPRLGVPEAVKTCHEASIHVVMVTGDHARTGAAIAKSIGIIWGMTMEELITERCMLGQEGLDEARASPDGLTPDMIAMLKAKPGVKPNFSNEFQKKVREQIEIEESRRSEADKLITARAVSGEEVDMWDKDRYTRDWYTAFEYVLRKGRQGLIFARTSPVQKRFIVNHFQQAHQYLDDVPLDDQLLAGELPEKEGSKYPILVKDELVTAVTGDGVNDAPALRAARIGICMGIMGTDVTKEAAAMILMDDNFASIVKGIKEGRLIFDNLKKSIAYTLSSNIPEISPFIMFIILRLPTPLSTVLILCIDLGTDMVPAISLAYENPEKDIMRRKPRSADDNLVTARLISFSYFQIGIVQALAGFYTYFAVMYSEGYSPSSLPGHGELADYFKPEYAPFGGFSITENLDSLATAQTAFFVSIVIVQWADILICKTRRLSLFQQGMKNDQLNFGLFFETALACFLVYTPGVRTVFGLKRLRFVYWLPAIPFSLLIVMYDETRKWIIRHHDVALDFFRFQKEKGLLKGDYDEDKYWNGEKQEIRPSFMKENPDWTPAEREHHQKLVADLSKTATPMQAFGKWVDRFTYW